MKKPKSTSRSKKTTSANFEPTKVSWLVAVVAATSLLLFAYLGAISS